MIKQVCIAAAFSLLTCAATAAQAQRDSATHFGAHASTSTHVAQELTNLELKWHRALERNDTETLDRILAREWFITNGSGRIIPKADLMQGLRAGEIRFVSTVPADITVHAYGDAAVVTKRSADKTMYGTSPGGGTYQMTDMFVKVDGRWQCVATHASRDITSQ